MAQEPDPPQARVDDRYTEGIYYDAASGDFCTIERGEDGAELINPQNGEVYHVIPYEEWTADDFMPVPEKAVDDPVSYFETWVSHQSSRCEMDVGLLFADVNTEVVETENYDWVVDP